MLKEWKSACPLNCYDVCGLRVYTEGNEIVKIKGDSDHPLTKGKICGKGNFINNRIYDKKRLLYPYKKINDEFIQISWEQAIKEISQIMINYKERYSSTSIMHSHDYSSGGLLKELDKRFFNYFGGVTEVDGSLCWGAGIKAQIYDFGDSRSHSVEDIINAKAIIIWGRNITTTNSHLYPYIIEAKQIGTKLIVIDPMKTNISKEADKYININPGMDGLLALAVAKVIIANEWHDKDFINNYSLGFESFYDQIKKIDINIITKEIGVSASEIYDLAKILVKDKPVMNFLGLGMQRYANGGNTIRAIDALIALSGNIGIKGGGVQYANLPVGKSFNWKELMANDLRLKSRTFSRPSQADDILHADNPPIKMIFITRSNPVVQLPDIAQTIKALNHIETKVVIDLYMTDTAKYADYLLPATSVFEEEDIYYGSMFHNVIRYGPKLIEPQGEAWTDLQIWTALARELSLEGFEKTTDNFLEIALKPLNKFGINLKSLKEKGQYLIPINPVSWSDKFFATPSGKFEFYSELAEKDKVNPVATIVYPLESVQNNKKLKEDFPYNLLTIHPSKSLHSQHRYFLKEKPWVTLSEEVAKENNLVNGDEIKVYNNRGEIMGLAKISKDINPKTIAIEEGWWIDTGFSANFLTSNLKSDLGKGSILYDCAVMLAKIEE